MTQNLTRSDVARGSTIPLPTLTQWIDGTYAGSYINTTERVRRYLLTMEGARQQVLALTALKAPGFVETPSSRELIDTLAYAQSSPELIVATMAAGMGKTTTCREYASGRSAVFVVTMRPTTSGVHAMLQELAQALEVPERNPARLDRSIGERLKRNGRHTLLIVDEAQNLADKSVDQLRYFLDLYGCGIALVGNEEVYTRFGKPEPRAGYGQIHRRVGKRMQRMAPLDGDIAALLDAWEVEDGECRRLLAAIGRKPGTLGQIDKTLRLAAMIAAGGGTPVVADHIRSAWRNRSGEAI
ncbi:hypothetical protein C3941_09255 [Kaistia algarum]|nr:hypothetical protein C3941_09255 [Kaistia algarum]